MEPEFLAVVSERPQFQRLDAATACNLARSERQSSDAPSHSKIQRSVLPPHERDVLLESILKIHSAPDLQSLLDTTVTAIEQYLQSDRVVIYQFQPHQLGKVAAAATAPQWQLPHSTRRLHNCFHISIGSSYLQGAIQSAPDVNNADFSPSQIAAFEQMQVRGFVSVPLLMPSATHANGQPQVWGLVVAHQCDRVRVWRQSELALLEHLSGQIAIAIDRCERIQHLEQRVAAQSAVASDLRQTAAEGAIALDDFATVAARKLRAPLRGISHLATWLAEDLQACLTPESTVQFDLLQQRVTRVDATIEDLLQYVRSGCVRSRPVRVDVGKLISQTIAPLAGVRPEAIELSSEMPILNTDRVALGHVFAQTIANAIEHHPAPERALVKIVARPQGDYYRFDVTDNGAGIAVEDRGRIFEPFHSSARHPESINTGLGLAIVKKSVEFQGGEVWLESQVGKGSTFSFTWRVEQSDDLVSSSAPIVE